MHLITSFQFTRSTIETNSMRSQHFFGHSLLNIGNIEWNKQSRKCWWKKKLIKFYKNEVIVLIKETIKRNQRSHAQFQRFADHCTFSFTLLGAQKMFKIQLISAALIWCRSITTAKKCERDEEKKLVRRHFNLAVHLYADLVIFTWFRATTSLNGRRWFYASASDRLTQMSYRVIRFVRYLVVIYSIN